MACEPFFLGKTYDDFLLRPQRGLVQARRAVPLTSCLTASLSLALPDTQRVARQWQPSALPHAQPPAPALAWPGEVRAVHETLSSSIPCPGTPPLILREKPCHSERKPWLA